MTPKWPWHISGQKYLICPWGSNFCPFRSTMSHFVEIGIFEFPIEYNGRNVKRWNNSAQQLTSVPFLLHANGLTSCPVQKLPLHNSSWQVTHQQMASKQLTRHRLHMANKEVDSKKHYYWWIFDETGTSMVTSLIHLFFIETHFYMLLFLNIIRLYQCVKYIITGGGTSCVQSCYFLLINKFLKWFLTLMCMSKHRRTFI